LSDVPHVADRIDPRIWKIAAVVFMGPFMTGLDSTVVNVSLSTLSHELHASIGPSRGSSAGICSRWR